MRSAKYFKSFYENIPWSFNHGQYRATSLNWIGKFKTSSLEKLSAVLNCRHAQICKLELLSAKSAYYFQSCYETKDGTDRPALSGMRKLSSK